MRVHFIRKETIELFIKKNAPSKGGFEEWFSKIKGADWNNIHDIKKTFNHADPLGESSERVVFDIGGNKYRIICKVFFGSTMVHLTLKWIGTHADYDKLKKGKKHYTVENYRDYESGKGN
ncbi:MAG: type II toxin-antitoxin system HigB family toxin [Candidatus Cyclobacteriaceae bacterium M2_1C_046]